MPTADILLVTATRVESEAVLGVFEESTKQEAHPTELKGRTYFDLGSVSGARVFLTQSEMGTGGLGAAQQTVQQGIVTLGPGAVILVGIAFGIDQQNHDIGEILVATQLRIYELQRVGLEIILRGDRPPASTRLLNRVRSADLKWRGAKVRFGVVLTGEKLVDSFDFREQLRTFEAEAIGGEMEGAGLYAACQKEKVDWILMKAICDWADGNKATDKEARQKLAARNSAEFVYHVIHFARWESEGSPICASVQSTIPTQPFFFGREKELASIADAILPESRTWGALIDGPGGIGKTALAVRAAHLAPAAHFRRKIFLSAKVRDLAASGEQPLQDFMLADYLTLLSELARELGDPELARVPENDRPIGVHRALAGERVLIVIDNVETFPEKERERLYQFLSRLPQTCKAIVTSRRRTDVDARIIRLDRLGQEDAMKLLAELAKTNGHLAAAMKSELQTLYEVTGGNPLLLRWTAAQLGRAGSHCRTVADACNYLRDPPSGNDPLEYIFGDLLGTFSNSETCVLAALSHFSQPATIAWIADVAELAEPQATTALEDLADRAVLVSDPTNQRFALTPLTAKFLQDRRPDFVKDTERRLAQRAYALALENGFAKHNRFHILEAGWPAIVAAMRPLAQGDNARLQTFCQALEPFLGASGRWDEWMKLEQQAEKRAVSARDFHNAGWRALYTGWIHRSRGEYGQAFQCATRAEEHWQWIGPGLQERASAIRLRATVYESERKHDDAIAAYALALNLLREIDPESREVAAALNGLAGAEKACGDLYAAKRDYNEALRIGKKIGDAEAILICTTHLSELALHENKLSEAEELARDALQLAEKMGRREWVGSNCDWLAKALVAQRCYKDALPYAHRAVELFTKTSLLGRLESAKTTMTECQRMVARKPESSGEL
jgi:nucleoside phosphorylase/tetratricopeptide (TPR) repeat protein